MQLNHLCGPALGLKPAPARHAQRSARRSRPISAESCKTYIRQPLFSTNMGTTCVNMSTGCSPQEPGGLPVHPAHRLAWVKPLLLTQRPGPFPSRHAVALGRSGLAPTSSGGWCASSYPCLRFLCDLFQVRFFIRTVVIVPHSVSA